MVGAPLDLLMTLVAVEARLTNGPPRLMRLSKPVALSRRIVWPLAMVRPPEPTKRSWFWPPVPKVHEPPV